MTLSSSLRFLRKARTDFQRRGLLLFLEQDAVPFVMSGGLSTAGYRSLLATWAGWVQQQQACSWVGRRQAASSIINLRSFSSSVLPAALNQGSASATSSPLVREAYQHQHQQHPLGGSRALHQVICSMQQQEQEPQLEYQHRSFRVEASYVGSRICVNDLLTLPELTDHYKKLHKGAVVVALQPGPVPDTCETEVGAWQPAQTQTHSSWTPCLSPAIQSTCLA
jgi:hypothetical protein